MTGLKEELKRKPEEGAVEYAERVEAALERHRQRTGVRRSGWGVMDGEKPGEALERIKALHEADGIREAERDRLRERKAKPGANKTSKERKADVTEASRRARAKSQERDVERAIEAFEEEKKHLHRRDGSRLYSDEEHAERTALLTTELRSK